MPSQFGQLFEAIVATVSGTILGSSAAADALAAKKYINDLKRTQNLSAEAQLELQRQQEILDKQTAASDIELQNLEVQYIKKVTIIGLVTLLAAVTIGLVAFYYSTVEGDINA